ncbi:MAG: hypothetical protein UR68_C0025G0024 [Candidatus Roizmanbacteria bacterium GW2011_GWA2_35_19]|uniref:Uncharacterized protein n=2 Tax=Candidatus Roizmaniibacteriota TaxID=1752723 RepID=A0A0G0BQX6_9BACT|nr:MAG: hypothetical protein UR63_C0059G0005 [Candidatus Roizmanbacteria bacterium GW2011_GWC2_35_12]KKP71879.1 MAG: hypothetical protein UR68_C0025G0024 [Candidatus Roizmanbacteria bacterium GW2011_GWA2_35_19]
MKKDKFCVNRTFLLFAVLLLVMVFTLPYIFSSKKTGYKSSAAMPPLTITPTPTPPLTSDPKKVLNYWIDYVRTNPYSTARKRFVKVGDLGLDYYDRYTFPYLLSGNYTNAEELKLIFDYIFRQRLVSGFTGNQNDYEFLFEIDHEIVFNHAESLLCSGVGNGDFDSPFGFFIFYAIRSGYFDNNPNTKLTLFRNRTNGEIEGFISSWWGMEKNIYKRAPQLIEYIPYRSFLNGFKYVLQQTEKPLTNSTKRVEGCSDYRIGKGLSIRPTGQWWKFAEGTLESARMEKFGQQASYKNILPAIQPVGGDNFKILLESITIKQFPELVIGPYEMTKKRQGLAYFQKLNYILDGSCSDLNSNYSRMASYFNTMGQFTNPHIYKTEKRMGGAIVEKAVAARSFINYIDSTCRLNSYNFESLNCLETCYLNPNPSNSFFISFEPLEDIIKGYDSKCNSVFKSVEFLVMTDESSCIEHDFDPLFK